jgi:uncharacterized membrane protein
MSNLAEPVLYLVESAQRRGGFMFAELQGGNGLPAFIVVIVILGLLVFAFMTAVRVWRQSNNSTTDSTSVDPAIAELRVRFARGEIGEDEYSRKASLLGYPTPSVVGEQSTPDSI